MMLKFRIIYIAWFLITLIGCNKRPYAPALTDDITYENSAGMRFVVPERWSVTAKSNIPDPLPDHPTRLAAYRNPQNVKAGLDVYVANLPSEMSLDDYLKANPIGPRNWKILAPAEELQVNGTPATRTLYAIRPGQKQTDSREIVAFRHNDVCFFFLLEHTSDDTKSREQARRAIETTRWN